MILCSGLKAAFEIKDNDRLNFFRNELSALGENSPELKDGINFLQQMVDGDFSAVNHETLTKFTNESNLELVIILIVNNRDSEASGRYFETLFKSYEENLCVIREYALYNLRKGNLERSERLLKKAVEKNISDPALYFYLISIYLQRNKLDELPELINQVVEIFGDNPAVISKLDILKEKLEHVI
jgi:tetratricopeptide (TPR) repeat protein